ncbi:hypothetical protein [uncultured Methanobacterium sp.]|uniref:hypothetical protein n=1 Tax=uncultured Methanobacterium sp. TaxID=176306 RepID=UPI002AA87F7B|nr:hypothetical protein [uncultured Methanobacterium sp.]
MKKIISILTILMLFICLMTISGCIENTKANNTWGEKKISLDAIKISNNTTGNHSETNESVYYVSGYIVNENPYEALNVKFKVISYDANGTVFAVNDTPYLDPKNIPEYSGSRFYARFSDPDKKIVRFDVKILSAKSEFV